MADSTTDHVTRPTEDPTASEVLSAMAICQPYTVGDLADHFPQASRWTIQRRLDDLVDIGDVRKKKHAKNRVSYWIPSE